jgi:hypothetical protein
MRGILGMIGVGLLLAGCEKQPFVVATLAGVPAECYVSHDANDETARQKNDPRWIPLPEADVTRSKAAWTVRKNKDSFLEMERLRAICDAGLRGA